MGFIVVYLAHGLWRVKIACCLNLQDDDGDLTELLELLQNDDSCSDEEGDGHACLMELAAHVASQPNAAARISQALGKKV